MWKKAFKMKRFTVVFGLLIYLVSLGQNKPILYDFADLPQSSLLNPALDNQNKFHVGIPLVSGFYSEYGNTGFTLHNLFADDGTTFNDKVNRVLNQMNSRDFGTLNTQIEVLNAGVRVNKDIYISFGFYHEIDAIAYYPRDVITLMNEGNSAYVGRIFSISQLNFKFDAMGVTHVGATVKLNENVTVGGRLKMYSSAANIQSRNNVGSFTTVLGSNNIYTHYLNNLDINFYSSGFFRDNEFITDGSSYLNNTFFGKNAGLGIDLGVSYAISPQLQFSASLLDFGYISYKEDNQNTSIKGSISFEGVDFAYDPNNPRNYWGEISDAFKAQVPITDNQDAYSSMRPAKFNAAMKYSFGERRSKVCYDNSYEDFYTDAVGVHLFTVFRPLFPQVALTGFYQKSLSDKIHAKVTYTVDDYSFHNLGFGFSMQLSKLNLYTTFDNILNYGNITETNNVSFQFGANIIFN